jgi:hypothetical protein
MKWFAKNVLLVHLFALVLAFCWIHGGTRADLLVPVIPWLTLLVLEWLLVFPQTKTTETLAESRRRVWRSLARDPLLYVSLVLTVLLIIPLFNVAAAPAYDNAIKQWVVPKPTVVWLPYCVNWTQHAVLLLWFPPVLLAALASKHGLLKKGKRMLLEGICWNGAALALVGFAQLLSGTDSLLWLTPMKSYFFSAFGYPNFAGAFFTLTAALSFGLWFHQVTEEAGQAPISFSNGGDDERPALLYTHRMLIPTVLMFAGAIASLSRAAILLSTVVFVVLTLYMLSYVWKRVTVGMRVTLVSVLGALILAIGVSLLVFKLEGLKRELQTITPSAVVERVTGSGYYHARVAKEMFRDHPFFGVGGWGYPRYQHQYFTPDDVKKMQIEGGANVHNDSLQFLAEQGAVGYGLILASVLLLVCPLCWQAWRLSRARVAFGVKDEPAREAGWLSRVPAPLIAVWVGTSATVCHSLGDLPFRAPSILIVWVLALSCVPGWLPAVKSNRP